MRFTVGNLLDVGERRVRPRGAEDIRKIGDGPDPRGPDRHTHRESVDEAVVDLAEALVVGAGSDSDDEGTESEADDLVEISDDELDLE